MLISGMLFIQTHSFNRLTMQLVGQLITTQETNNFEEINGNSLDGNVFISVEKNLHFRSRMRLFSAATTTNKHVNMSACVHEPSCLQDNQ